MSDRLQGKKIAFLTANEGVEQVELVEPLEAVREAGAEAELLAPEAGEVQAFNHLDKADTFQVDRPVGEADAGEYDGLVLPGGVANPDQLRTEPEALEFVRGFFAAGKPVGVICHGPWTLIDAGVAKGRTLTSWPSLETDLRNAGAELGRRGGPRRPGPRLQPQTGRPGSVQGEDRRGVRRGRPRGPAPRKRSVRRRCDATARCEERQQTRPPVQTHKKEREGRGTLGEASGGDRRPHGQQGKGEVRRNEELVAP